MSDRFRAFGGSSRGPRLGVIVARNQRLHVENRGSASMFATYNPMSTRAASMLLGRAGSARAAPHVRSFRASEFVGARAPKNQRRAQSGFSIWRIEQYSGLRPGDSELHPREQDASWALGKRVRTPCRSSARPRPVGSATLRDHCSALKTAR